MGASRAKRGERAPRGKREGEIFLLYFFIRGRKKRVRRVRRVRSNKSRVTNTQRKLYSEYSYWRILIEQARTRERRGARATRGSLRGLFLPHQEQVLRRGEVMGSQLRFDPGFFGLALRAAAEADAFLFSAHKDLPVTRCPTRAGLRLTSPAKASGE